MRLPLLAMLLTAATVVAACTMPGGSSADARLDGPAAERAAREDRDARTDGRDADVRGEATGVKPGAAAPGRVESEADAPPMSTPMPPERAAGAVDRSCRTNADCAVKNVGNCCGAMPACVNVAARPDPAAVQAQCAREGMSSVCGFKDIQGCACVAGTCQDADGAVADR